MIRPPNTPEVLSSFHDLQIQTPEKIAQPGLLNASNTIASEKMLVRDESCLLLPTPTLNKETFFSPMDKDSSWAKQDVEYIDQPHSAHHTPPELSARKVGIEERLADRPREVKVGTKEYIGATVLPEEKGDDSIKSDLGRECAFGSDSVDSFPLSMGTVEPARGTGAALGREITEEMVPETAQMAVHESVEEESGSVEAENQPEPLPRYTSADAQIFEQFKYNRLSFKQDHSYIGRLRDSYHPPETVSQPTRVIRDDNFYLKPSPPCNPDPKP